MSVDRSLKIKGMLSRHRNVLSRTERIESLKDQERWQEGDSVLGLPKVAHRKSHAGKKAKEEKPVEVAATEAAATAATAAPAGKAATAAKTPAGAAKAPAGKAPAAKAPAAKAPAAKPGK
jgi:small basic protein (TIGR04137 family)